MIAQRPLVTVGIPTYNRELLVGRAIESVLKQDYPHIEIVISDNCSSDSTPSVCKGFAVRDPRVRYVRQSRNVGATGNFERVLTLASGEFFMWLGDDDYIDPNYISTTLEQLQRDPAIALASGLARYYRGEALIDKGRAFNVEGHAWWGRIARYYWKVSDNAVFYGLMRTATIRQVSLKNVVGGDWLAIAHVAASGKLVMLDQTAVHRELGGASRSHAENARSLGVSSIQAMFPYVSIAAHAFADIATGGPTYSRYGLLPRRLAASLVFLVLIVRALSTSIAECLVTTRDNVRHKLGGA